MPNALRAIPVSLFPAILYALIAVPIGHDSMATGLTAPLFSMVLPSGANWVVARGDALLMFAALCLFIEIVKATSTRGAAIVGNSLAVIAFTLCLVAFLLIPAFGTNIFFLISGMILVDFIAGFIVMIVSSRRDVSFGAG